MAPFTLSMGERVSGRNKGTCLWPTASWQSSLGRPQAPKPVPQSVPQGSRKSCGVKHRVEDHCGVGTVQGSHRNAGQALQAPNLSYSYLAHSRRSKTIVRMKWNGKISPFEVKRLLLNTCVCHVPVIILSVLHRQLPQSW